MPSFLYKKKDDASFDEMLSAVPESTRINKKYAVTLFEKFVDESYQGRSTKVIIDELLLIKKTDPQNYEDSLYGMLQGWINWNQKNGRCNSTIRVAFSNTREYLFYYGVKTHEQDIKGHLRFGKKTHEEKHPLSQREYQRIIDALARHPLVQGLFLALGSSGMRIGEALSLKKKDLDLTGPRIKVNIPATTKTRTGRTTYLSLETGKVLRPRLENIGLDDSVFTLKNSNDVSSSIRTMLSRTVDRLQLVDKYQSNNIRKITTHSFRAYFFTKAARKHGENYAHKLVGHGGYLMQYDRMTEEEKLEMYIELEPDLAVFEQTKNELEINRLRDKVDEIDSLRDEVRKLRESQAKSDKKLIETMKINGIIKS